MWRSCANEREGTVQEKERGRESFFKLQKENFSSSLSHPFFYITEKAFAV